MKKVKQIFLTPNNVLDYQEDDVYSFEGRKHLVLHMELSAAIEDSLNSKCGDGGGLYAEFLNNIGLQHQTDKGWWNETAVDLDNIQFFVDYHNGELEGEYYDDVERLKEKLSNMPKGVCIELKPDHTNVEDYLLNN